MRKTKSRELPEEITGMLTSIANQLASKYTFGYHSVEDLKQEAILLGISGYYSGYDPERGSLFNFLYTHIKNRLSNYKRNKFQRLDKPCLRCPVGAYIKKGDKCTAYTEKIECKLYKNWESSNISKENIMSPAPIGCISSEEHRDKNCYIVDENLHDLDLRELAEMLDDKISWLNRRAWLKLLAGHKLLANESENLLAEIQPILKKMRLIHDNYDY